MNTIEITMRLFGAFRKYGENTRFFVPSGSSVQDVKNALVKALDLDDAALVHDSAIANDNEIISSNVVFTQDAYLAILPPVCGG